MPCDNCGSNLTIAVIEREINGKKVRVRLCEHCLSTGSPRDEAWIKGIIARQERGEKSPRQDICPQCGASAEEISSEQKPGCPKCYDFFPKEIKKLVASAQQEEKEHIGKKPKRYQGN
jgi:protein-arginine kinase activator protein McsA